MLRTEGTWFKDEHGRTLLLRGINLGGSTKVPYEPDGATHIRESFFDHRGVSFVGRPFPLEEADEHFTRLKSWGFTFLRLLITWEAVEHAGPGEYDGAYLDYLYEVVKRAGDHGLRLFIDPHQDVWSRLSGGDGAPGWTFEVVGMDVTKFEETGAAVVHATHGDPFPRMIWPTNYGKFAAATLFTLFFGGDDFAPRTTVEGEPVQAYLQRHYIDAVKQVALRLRDFDHVVGYDTLNEPSAGYIGVEDLEEPFGLLLKGPMPSPYASMLLAAGYPQEVGVYDLGLLGVRRKESRRLNPEGVSLWREGYEPVWRANGVWGLDETGEPVLLRPDHFERVGEREVDFDRDYFRPFANRFAEELRGVHPGALVFVESEPGDEGLTWTGADAEDVVHAGHWYDAITLFTKNFRPWFTLDLQTGRPVLGKGRVRRTFVEQVAAIKEVSEVEMGGVPTLIGEVGIPFDMEEGKAYRTGDFSKQVRALDTSFDALEANLVSYTLWNYTADNTNERGDQWNGEDLSIFSRDQQKGTGSIHDGGRALRAVVRPHALATAGEPQYVAYDVHQRTFDFIFRHDPEVRAPTEIYVPNLHYPEGYVVEVSDGRYTVDQQAQRLFYEPGSPGGEHRLQIRPFCSGAEGLLSAEERRVYRLKGLMVLGALTAGGLLVWRALTRRKRKEQ